MNDKLNKKEILKVSKERIYLLLKSCKNIVLLGEAGSGKSEVGINLSELFVEKRDEREIHLFDLDQTKPLFRTRDLEQDKRLSKIKLHYQKQLMDSPVIVGGVEEALLNPSKRVVLDIGGGEQGARMIGQFREVLRENSMVLYLINNYRPWSSMKEDIAWTMDEIMEGCGLNRFCFVANPNLGPDTSLHDIMNGYIAIHERLEIKTQFLCALSELAEDVSEAVSIPVLPIHLALATSRVEQMGG